MKNHQFKAVLIETIFNNLNESIEDISKDEYEAIKNIIIGTLEEIALLYPDDEKLGKAIRTIVRQHSL